jgi:hypothetical protein
MGVKVGTAVPAPEPALRKGARGLSEFNFQQFVCAQIMTEDERLALMKQMDGSGAAPVVAAASSAVVSSYACTLPVLTTAVGRHREFSSLAELCEEENFDDFPLEGPRTGAWCLNFLRRRHTPTDHHLSFRTIARLQPDSWGMAEHEQLLKMIELGGCFDQLDLSNLACADMAFRRLQVI